MLSPAELTLLADEIQRLAVPSRVEKIHQPAADRIVLKLAAAGGDHHLLIVASRNFARAHLVLDPPENPKSPPPFCDDLRRLLTPGRLVLARTLPGDAVLVLDFEVRGEKGSESRRLVAELFGARPNIAVVARDGTILAVLATRESGARPFVVGGRYVDPRRPERELAPRPPFVEFTDGPPPPQPAQCASWGPRPALAGTPSAPLSRLVELAVTPRESAALLDEARGALLEALAQEDKKLHRRLANIETDVRGADQIPRLKREGEILKAHLGEMKRGMKHLDATDWADAGEAKVRIVLDPMRTPKEEVAYRFDEARRLERQQIAAAERRGEVEARLRALEALAERAGAADSEDAIAAIRSDAGIQARREQALPGKKTVVKPEPRKPYRTFLSKDGIEMMVGRTGSDNDELTFQVAHGNDFWFHVRDYPGSHVVIRAREQLPEETMLDAATLAVHFSRSDSAGKRDVSWTRRKFVSKARGAPAGQVLLSSHKTIHLRVEPERLKRLLKGSAT